MMRDRVEDGSLDLVRGRRDGTASRRRSDGVAVRQVAHDVLDHHDRAFHDHAEIERAQRKQVGGNVSQIQADGCEQQRERNRQRRRSARRGYCPGTGTGSPRPGSMPSVRLCSTVSVVKCTRSLRSRMRNDLHARRQETLIELLDLLVQRRPARVRIRTLAQQHDPGDHVVVVDHLALLAVDCLTQLAQPDLRPLLDTRDVAHAHGSSVLRLQHRVADVVVTFVTSPTARTLICLRPASIKLPPAFTLLLASAAPPARWSSP